jgi:Bacterial regulatory proteins, luxR family
MFDRLLLFGWLLPQRDPIGLPCEGVMRRPQVAAKTGLAEPTVKMHRGQAMRKMGAKSVADLVKMAEILGNRINSDFCRSPNVQSERRPANAASRTPFSVRTWPSKVTESDYPGVGAALKRIVPQRLVFKYYQTVGQGKNPYTSGYPIHTNCALQ